MGLICKWNFTCISIEYCDLHCMRPSTNSHIDSVSVVTADCCRLFQTVSIPHTVSCTHVYTGHCVITWHYHRVRAWRHHTQPYVKTIQHRTGYASLHLSSQTVLYDSLTVSMRYEYAVLSHRQLILIGKVLTALIVSPRPDQVIVWVAHPNWPAITALKDKRIDHTVIDRNTPYNIIHWYETRRPTIACHSIYSIANCPIYLTVIMCHWVTLVAHCHSPLQSHTGGRSLWWWCHQPVWLFQCHLALSVFTCHIESSVRYMPLLIFTLTVLLYILSLIQIYRHTATTVYCTLMQTQYRRHIENYNR